MTRLNPRRTIPVQVRTYTPTADGMPAWAPPVSTLGVLEAKPQTPSDLTPVGKLLVADQKGVEVRKIFGLHARVDVAGLTLAVTGVADTWSRRRAQFLEVALADPLPAHLGWRVAVSALDGGGMDDNNDPLPQTTQRVESAVVVPAGSLEPDDRRVAAETSAQLYLPAGESIGSTATVTVEGSPLEGIWQAVGDPEVTPTRTVIKLQR